MDSNSVILIAGPDTMIGRALVKYFRSQKVARVLSSAEMRIDLLDPLSVRSLFESESPSYVVLTSLRSGGIVANQRTPAEFIYENLQAQNNVIHLAWQNGVRKLLFVGASCVYPRDCPQPMKEEYFLTGAMEKTSEPYAVAKAAGIVMCQAYQRQYGFSAISMIPATVYGPGGTENADEAHVIDALIARFTKAVKEKASVVQLLGTGEPRREFLFVDDFARACGFLLENYNDPLPINVGTGTDVSIKRLAEIIREECGFVGEIRWDTSQPDGASRKLLDSSRLRDLGWSPRIGLQEGIRQAIGWGLAGDIPNTG